VVLLNIFIALFNLESSSIGEGSCNAGNACRFDESLGKRIVKQSNSFFQFKPTLPQYIHSVACNTHSILCLPAESGATSSITVSDSSCNEYYSCAYTSGLFNIYVMSLLLNSQLFFGSMHFAFHLGTTGTANISHDACTGVYAYVGLNSFMVHV
jgi:hypothetical protein